MDKLTIVCWWLVIIGALNWGFVVLGFNIVDMIFATIPMLEDIVYSLIGLSAIYLILEKFDIV